jgi:hypothetical protein
VIIAAQEGSDGGRGRRVAAVRIEDTHLRLRRIDAGLVQQLGLVEQLIDVGADDFVFACLGAFELSPALRGSG